VYQALRNLGYELGATVIRVFAYIGVVAVLAVAIIRFFDVAEVRAAIEPSPRIDWTTIERPYRAFALNTPQFPETDYAIRRHSAGGRKDILTVPAEDGAGPPRLMVEIYRPGREYDQFGSDAREAAARTAALGGPYGVSPAEPIASKFGRVNVFEFTARSDGNARNCLAFARAFNDPRLQITGWYCKNDVEVVDRRTLACAIEGLSLLAAASEPKVQQLFANAEQKRVFCAPRTPLRGATMRRHDWIEGPNRPKLRRSVAAK
jgi:hypothetical protein